MANNRLIKSFNAGGAIAANRLVRHGAADDLVLQAQAATDALVGVTTRIAASVGERVDVVMGGTADVELGGSVALGGPLTADAQGRAVTAAPAAGVNHRIVGYALAAGVAGDRVLAKIDPGVVQG